MDTPAQENTSPSNDEKPRSYATVSDEIDQIMAELGFGNIGQKTEPQDQQQAP